MEPYNPKEIEPKWQKYWENHPELNAADSKSPNEKKYILDMFPYPSGDGLHVGHVESYTATDIISRYLRMNGKNVLHPTGWDAFGLPAENYAIKTKIHPSITTQKAIAIFKNQMKKLGLSYDWSREVNSSDPEYYKWTQWFFLLLYKNRLAYRKKASVNFCPKCQTVLANEQVIFGKCERCETEVVQKDLEQWFFRITDFIEDSPKEVRPLSTKTAQRGRTSMASGLLDGLDKIDWPESTKAAQKNWIGKSEGAIIRFSIVSRTNTDGTRKNAEKIQHKSASSQRGSAFLEVFTTRLDTIYGCTYCVVAPEHKLITDYKLQITNYGEIEKYLIAAQNKTELERMESKDKTGVEIKGIKAINPFASEAVPVFVADYVLGHYGTGAVMAVPAHDERDWEFAKKYNLPVRQSVAPHNIDKNNPPREGMENTVRKVVHVILENSKGEVLTLNLKGDEWEIDKPKTFIIGGIEGNENPKTTALREIKEETGYTDIEIVKIYPIEFHAEFYAAHKKVNRYVKTTGIVCKLKSEARASISKEEEKLHNIVWVKKDILTGAVNIPDDIFFANAYIQNNETYTNDGVLVNSEKYSGLTSKKSREKMANWLEENNLGGRKINYKIRDWLVSRQRYWGAPIPIIYCDKCGTVPVPEKDLPVVLPDDVDFNPTGESPLIKSRKFHNVKCPTCGSKDAFRESDTMDTFVCSSWYYFRYTDPKNSKVFADKEKIKKWLPVDLYIGGADHAVLHLLYSRFFTKVLHKLGYINFDEPFLKLRHQGTVLGEDGYKMSKSRGNVVNPDDVVKDYGADILRTFEMFMGPLEDMKPWNIKGIIGIKRFLEKVWKLNKNVIASEAKQSRTNNSGIAASPTAPRNDKTEASLHKTIKKVTEDIENFRFNTAISQMMILVNEMEREKNIPITNYKLLITILSPFAPHISEELWQKLGHKESIFKEKWPEYDPKLIKDEEIDLVIQVNGRVRDTIKANADISEDEAKKLALASEKVKKFTEGKDIKKTIFVKGKLINLVA